MPLNWKKSDDKVLIQTVPALVENSRLLSCIATLVVALPCSTTFDFFTQQRFAQCSLGGGSLQMKFLA